VPDTVTPTVTPTPIVHVVQQGDTLQAIAFDFGVSVDALQRANGIENPQFLQIGQRLIIPVQQDPDQTTMDLLLPTPTPQPIQVQGTASYETPVGSLLVLGEVANTTAVTLTNVQVQVTLIDAAGEPLVDTNTFAPLDLLAPGARSPFSILFTTPPSDWVNYQVTVIRGQKAGALASGYVPISVVESEGGPAGPQFRVNGVVENVSAGRSAQSVDVVITTYDSEGTVTGFRQSALAPDTADGQLTPGGEMAFSLLLTTHGDVPADFAVTALGHAANGMTSGG
jgi:murein DD-endopeptidase MepM/ murein hydrolase activator NlpD